MRRRVYLATLGATATGGVAGCLTLADVTGGDEYDIGMTRNEFVPETYEATVGDTVVWQNTSESMHTVTAYEDGIPDEADYFASGDFESEEDADDAWHDDLGGGLEPRETYEHTFDVAGTYSYYCIPHETDGNDKAWMVASVDVTE